MRSMIKKLYITTPIYYVNDRPHIGHAYTSLACDVMARFFRLFGQDVFFLTGTDEHGLKIEKAAELAQIPVKEFVDKVSKNFEMLETVLNLTNDDFIRTTEERHTKAVHHFWKVLEDNGHIYLGSYSGWYAVRDEAFYSEDELVDGKAPTGAPVEWVTEESYFFKLSAFQEPLLAYYDQHLDFIQPSSRRNEVLNFVRSGLRDLSISRTSFKWGIPVPSDPSHVIYVWLDALVNYITAIGYPHQLDHERWKNTIHVVGKDILRFHAVYWPALLMAAGLPLPRVIFAHGWWTNDGQKISKSLGNVVDPVLLVQQYGLDSLRYFLFKEMSFGQDGDFSHLTFVNRLNNDLANKFGNLAQRTLSFINRYANGIITKPQEFTPVDHSLIDLTNHAFEKSLAHMESFALHKYIETVWDVIDSANQYVDSQKPWGLRTGNQQRLETVLYTLCIVLKNCAILLQPLLPKSCAQLLDMLSVPADKRGIEHRPWVWEDKCCLPPPTPLFVKAT